MVLVKNIIGTSDNLPDGYLSWRDFWAAKKGYWPKYCAAYGCNETAVLGGHVKKVNGYDNKWYIVPICYSHNNSDETFYVEESMLVPVR